MSAIYIALPVALLLAIAAVIAFIWAVRSGQMDDLDTPGSRPLIDDEPPRRRARNSADDDSAPEG